MASVSRPRWFSKYLLLRIRLYILLLIIIIIIIVLIIIIRAIYSIVVS